MRIPPVERWVEVGSDPQQVVDTLRAVVLQLNGRIVSEDDRLIDVHFGSLSKSRFIGEFWVSGRTLPSRARLEVYEGDSAGRLRIRVFVEDRHRWGFKWGFVSKYERSLKETARELVEGIIRADSTANEVWLGANAIRIRGDLTKMA